jgi:hypothetical protein
MAKQKMESHNHSHLYSEDNHLGLKETYTLSILKYSNKSVIKSYIPAFSVKFCFQPIYTYYANWAYFDKGLDLNPFPLKLLDQIKQNVVGMALGCSPFKIVSDNPALHSR